MTTPRASLIDTTRPRSEEEATLFQRLPPGLLLEIFFSSAVVPETLPSLRCVSKAVKVFIDNDPHLTKIRELYRLFRQCEQDATALLSDCKDFEARRPETLAMEIALAQEMDAVGDAVPSLPTARHLRRQFSALRLRVHTNRQTVLSLDNRRHRVMDRCQLLGREVQKLSCEPLVQESIALRRLINSFVERCRGLGIHDGLPDVMGLDN